MTYDQIGELTLDQLRAEFKADVRPRKVQESARAKKSRELFDTICFLNKLTPAQLGNLDPEDVRTMLMGIDTNLVVDVKVLGPAMKDYAKRQSQG